MKIDFPTPKQNKQLMKLWQEAFGDTEDFVEGFFYTAFSPSRCRCVLSGRKVVAAAYWLDVRYAGQRYAYIYAVAVDEKRRGKGICSQLMADLHAHLTLRGYDGALLVPQSEQLRAMYEHMGYSNCTTVSEFTCEAAGEAVALHRIDRDTYARLRRDLLPEGSAIQEEENIAFLETMAFFYQGEDLLVAAHAENGHLRCPELLGNISQAPGVLTALNCSEGFFRTPGKDKPFAMFLPLKKNAQAPEYLGLAFD